MAIQKAPSLNYLTTPSSAFYNPQRPFTLMFWVRFDAIDITATNFQSVMGTYTAAGGVGWEIRSVGNGTAASLGLQVSGTAALYNDYHNDGKLIAGRWMHFAVAFDFNAAIASRRSSYLDGSPLTQGAAIGTDNTNIPNAAGVLRIGHDSDNATSFSGALAYIRMFDGLLSQAEVIAEMRSQTVVNRRLPVMFDYPFDASGGNNVIGVDRSQNRLHVTGKTGTVNWDAGPRLPKRETLQLLSQDAYKFALTGAGNLTSSPSDPVGITDAITVVANALVNPADPVGITDALTTAMSFVQSPADPVGITDSVTAVISKDVTQPDPVGITDALAVQADTARTQPDPVGVTDALSATMSAVRAQDDPVGISDAAAVVFAGVRTQADPVGISDSVTVTLGGNATPSDPVGITDALTTVADSQRAPADPVGISDTLIVSLTRVVNTDDPVGVTDTVTMVQSATRTQTDPVGITDSLQIDFTGSSSRTINDPVGVTDVVSAQADAVRTTADPVGVTDAVAVIMARVSDLTDPVGVTDAVTSALAAQRTASDPVGITDAVFVTVGKAATQADPVGISDTVSVSLVNAPLGLPARHPGVKIVGKSAVTVRRYAESVRLRKP